MKHLYARPDESVIRSLIQNFHAMLGELDYGRELAIFNLGRLQFGKTKRLKAEFKALYVGLWNLALKRTFPEAHEEIFRAYMNFRLEENPREKEKRLQENDLIHQYVEALAIHGDADFQNVARHLLSFSDVPDSQLKPLNLKLALHIRSMYDYFFKHLFSNME